MLLLCCPPVCSLDIPPGYTRTSWIISAPTHLQVSPLDSILAVEVLGVGLDLAVDCQKGVVGALGN